MLSLKSGLCLLVMVATVASVEIWRDCSGGKAKGTINSVVIDPPCHPTCTLKHNTNVSLTVNFTPHEDGSVAKSTVYGALGIFPVDVLWQPEKDLCKDGKMTCPFTAGTPVVYRDVIPVLAIYPNVRVAAKWHVKNAAGEDIICFALPVKIID